MTRAGSVLTWVGFALLRAANLLIRVMTDLGAVIVHRGHWLLYALLVIAGWFYPAFALFIIFCLLFWGYRELLDSTQA